MAQNSNLIHEYGIKTKLKAQPESPKAFVWEPPYPTEDTLHSHSSATILPTEAADETAYEGYSISQRRHQ